MSTLPTTTNNDGSLSRGEVAYVLARNQSQAHNLLLRAVKESGLTQKELAARTGIDEATVSRVLARPRNIELNTLGKLLFAARGAYLQLSLSYPGKGKSQPVFLAHKATDAAQSSANAIFVYDFGEPRSIKSTVSMKTVSTNAGRLDRIMTLDTNDLRIREKERA